MTFRAWLLLIYILALAVSRPGAQDQGRRIELEEALQSRYRITVLGGGLLSIHGGDNAIRKAGGVVVLLNDGLYGSYDRSHLTSNAIRDGGTDVFSGGKDVALVRGEKFYVTAVHVGTDTVVIGLLSARMIPGARKNAQVWATANFFFDKDTLAQGNIGKVDAVLNQWILPEGALSAPPAALAPATAPPIAAASTVSSSSPVELKPGMTRDEIVDALGMPIQDVSFGDHRWLTYPGITVSLEQGKVTTADRNAQSLTTVKISSDPTGADVLLDGSFVSSAPAVLRLPPGTYKIVVKMSGYADWEREVKILPGAEVSLDAQLSK
jgi:hypothetical protein